MDYIVKAYKDWKLHSQFQEIVPDMDDDYMSNNEKQSIRRSLKKYGSTCCNHMRNNEKLIRHDVEKTDTLQGIALKYGCTTEQIRRSNRLFASDSLFMRQFLLIPVDKTSPYYPTPPDEKNSRTSPSSPTDSYIFQEKSSPTEEKLSSISSVLPSNSDPLTSSYIITTEHNSSTTDFDMTIGHNARTHRADALPTRPYSIAGELYNQIQPKIDDNYHHRNSSNSCNNSVGEGGGGSGGGGGNKQSKSLDSVVATMSPEEENRKCINDFLNKIDTTISESKKYVERSKEMIATQNDVDFFANADFVERGRNNNLNNSYKNKNQQQNHIRHSSTGSSSDTAQLLNTTQMRRVQNSLKRLEKQQDEFFEL